MVENELPIMMLLNQVSHMYKQKIMRILEPYQLKPGQVGMIFILNRCGEASQKELARRLNITPPAVTVALRKLEELGYVEKAIDKKDQRATVIKLTEKGVDTVNELREQDYLANQEAFHEISEPEQLFLRRLLSQMRQNIMEGSVDK